MVAVWGVNYRLNRIHKAIVNQIALGSFIVLIMSLHKEYNLVHHSAFRCMVHEHIAVQLSTGRTRASQLVLFVILHHGRDRSREQHQTTLGLEMILAAVDHSSQQARNSHQILVVEVIFAHGTNSSENTFHYALVQLMLVSHFSKHLHALCSTEYGLHIGVRIAHKVNALNTFEAQLRVRDMLIQSIHNEFTASRCHQTVLHLGVIGTEGDIDGTVLAIKPTALLAGCGPTRHVVGCTFLKCFT